MQRENMTFLIVEDNAGIRRILRRILAGMATAIWECADGADALAAYEEHRPDIVLMDLRMPHIDGLTATRQIRGYDPSARIVIVTDYEDDDMRTAALDAGAREYVLKHEISALPELLLSLSGPDTNQ